MTYPQYTRGAGVVVPLHLQVIHHMNLWYPKTRSICIELDARERPKLIVEGNLRKLAVDVSPAGWQSNALLDGKHLFLEYAVVAVS